MKKLGALTLTLILVAAGATGCGGSGEDGTGGEEAAIDRVFDEGKFPPRLADQICEVIDDRGEEEARRLFVETWSSDAFEFSGGELFDEAASRC